MPHTSDKAHGSLAQNVLGLWDGIVLGFASAAPGISIAGVLGGIAGVSGYGALLALLVGFIPMIFIAFSFYHLNRWRADVGISYAWVGRILSPMVGAFVGILILIAFVVSNSFAIIPAATNFLTIFSSSAANNKWLVTVLGSVFLGLITLLVVTGIRLAARFQWALTAFELTVMTIFGFMALHHGLTHRHPGSTPSIHWFSLHSAGGGSGLLAGLLISVFWYSGWETSVVVNEETKKSRRNPGLAGIGSLVAVVAVSIFFGALFFSAVNPVDMSKNSAWMSTLGLQLAGRPWGYLLVLAIMAGYLGGIETTIITFGNVGYSMGRDGVLWRAFARVGDKSKMPWLAITALSVPSFLMFIIQVWSGGSLATIVADLASSLGLMFVVYYALTALTAAWMLRGIAKTNLNVALTGVLLPLLGALILTYIGLKTWGGTAGPVKVTFIVAVIAALAITAISRLRGTSSFFQEKVKGALTQADMSKAGE